MAFEIERKRGDVVVVVSSLTHSTLAFLVQLAHVLNAPVTDANHATSADLLLQTLTLAADDGAAVVHAS